MDNITTPNSVLLPMTTVRVNLEDYIRSIPDFPTLGILFRDITPLLRSMEAFREAIRRMCEPYRDQQVDVIASAEARGFIFAAPMALELGAGFVPVRKPGKLPFDTHAFHYELEYGKNVLEIHIDGITEGQNVLLVDDLLATAGTIEACCKLVEKCGAHVLGCAFLIELAGLGGADRIRPYKPFSVIQYG